MTETNNGGQIGKKNHQKISIKITDDSSRNKQ